MPVFEISAREILAGDKNKAANWPGSNDADNRLRPDCRPVVAPKFGIATTDKIFTIGSCFARNLEEYLQRQSFNVLSTQLVFPASELQPFSRPNDLLVKYTAASIYEELSTALGEVTPLADEQYVVSDGRGYYDVNLPMSYPSVTLERCIARRKEVRALFQKVTETDTLILTLGLIEHWYDTELGIYICATPAPRVLKRFPDRFVCRQLGFDEVRSSLEMSLDLLKSVNPQLKIVITTSPVPLGHTFTSQDVIIANMYSKSMLRVISQDMAMKRSYVDYFPSYEMVMLSDPDASWASDQIHVSDSRVGVVMAHFFRNYVGGADTESERIEQYRRAVRSFEAGDHVAAVGQFRELEQVYSGNEAFLRKYIASAICAEAWHDAFRVSSSYIDQFPEQLQVLLQHGRSAVMTEQYDIALKTYERLEAYPSFKLMALGWEMEVGARRQDEELRIRAAKSAAEAIISDANLGAENAVPLWVLKRTKQILRTEPESVALLQALERLESAEASAA